MFSKLLTFVPIVLAVVSATADASRPRVVHNGVAKRLSGELARRYSSARWTFYDVGLGACGQTNVATDFIVALNADQFGSGYPGPHCFKKIQMTYNGKSATATVMDRCPGCPYGGLDLSRGLFTHFGSEDQGILYGEWSFVDDGAAPAPAPATTKAAYIAPAVTTKAQAVPTTHQTKAWVPPTTSTKAWAAPTTHSKKVTATPLPIVPASGASAVSSPPSSSSKKASHTKAPTTSAPAAAAYSASLASASSSVASMASTFSALAPSATSNATAANSTTGTGATNTTAEIEHNLNEINALMTKLSELIMSASLGNNSSNSTIAN